MPSLRDQCPQEDFESGRKSSLEQLVSTPAVFQRIIAHIVDHHNSSQVWAKEATIKVALQGVKYYITGEIDQSREEGVHTNEQDQVKSLVRPASL